MNAQQMSPELRELLNDIQGWMIENDYECGEVGSQLYREISQALGEKED